MTKSNKHTNVKDMMIAVLLAMKYKAIPKIEANTEPLTIHFQIPLKIVPIEQIMLCVEIHVFDNYLFSIAKIVILFIPKYFFYQN